MKNKIFLIFAGVLISVLVLVFLFPGKKPSNKSNEQNLSQAVPAPGSEGVNEMEVNSNTDSEDVEGETSNKEGVVREITVEGRNFEFSEEKITLNVGEKVSLTFKSTQGFHNFMVDELNLATKTIGAGDEDAIEFVVPDKPGTYAFYCSVGNHRALGMEGVLEVR